MMMLFLFSYVLGGFIVKLYPAERLQENGY
jgi:hypothetical protein